MKVINEKDYSYLGTSRGWHVFISTKKSFDPELLYLYRARMILKDGSFKFFDPIVRDKDMSEEQDYLILEGNTVDGNSYCMMNSVDLRLDEGSCVRKLNIECMA